MEGINSIKIQFFKDKIANRLTELKPYMSDVKYRMYMSIIKDCKDLDELREMAEMDLQFNMVQYISEITDKIKLSDTSIDELEAVINQNTRAAKLTVIMPKKKEKVETYEEVVDNIDEIIEDEEVLNATANLLYMRMQTAVPSELDTSSLEYEDDEEDNSLVSFDSIEADDIEDSDEEYAEDGDEDDEEEDEYTNEEDLVDPDDDYYYNQDEDDEEDNNDDDYFDDIDEESFYSLGGEEDTEDDEEDKKDIENEVEKEQPIDFGTPITKDESSTESLSELFDDTDALKEDEQYLDDIDPDDLFGADEEDDYFEDEEDEEYDDEEEDDEYEEEIDPDDDYANEENDEEDDEDDDINIDDMYGDEDDDEEDDDDEDDIDIDDMYGDDEEEEDYDEEDELDALESIDPDEMFGGDDEEDDEDEEDSDDDLNVDDMYGDEEDEDEFDIDEDELTGDIDEEEANESNLNSLFDNAPSIPNTPPRKRAKTQDKVFINGTKRGKQTQDMFNVILNMMDKASKLKNKTARR